MERVEPAELPSGRMWKLKCRRKTIESSIGRATALDLKKKKNRNN